MSLYDVHILFKKKDIMTRMSMCHLPIVIDWNVKNAITYHFLIEYGTVSISS